MERAKKIIFSERGLAVFIIFLSSAISFWPTIFEYLNRGKIFPDREFELVYGFIWDFHVYLSKMIQGARGGWLVFEKFTTEPHDPSLLQIFYLLLGKIGALSGFSLIFTYHFSRILFGVLWFWGGYLFIKFCFVQSQTLRKLAFLLFVFSGNIPKLVTDQAGYGLMFLGKKWELYLAGWSHMNPVTRPAFVPHWNAGHFLTAMTLIFLYKWQKEANAGRKIRMAIIAGIFGLLSGFILPPTLIISLVILSLGLLFNIINSIFSGKGMGKFWINLATSLPFYFLSLIPLMYNVWITQFYPWKALVEGDMLITRYSFNYPEYIWGLGSTGVLGILGALLVLLTKNTKLHFASFWVLGTFGLIILFDKFLVWHNQTRFVQVGIELPLAILTVYFLNYFLIFVKKWRNSILTTVVIFLLLPMVLVWTIGTSLQIDFIKQKLLGAYPAMMMGPFVVYPSGDIWEALKFLDQEKDQKNVFSGPAFGNYLGAYTGKFAYIGHGAQTVAYYQEKLPNVEKFYKGKMTTEEIEAVFNKHRIGYVVFGPEEKSWGDKLPNNDMLEPVFQKKEMTIYKVKNP